MGQKFVEGIWALPLEAVVHFPGSGAPQLLLLCGLSVLGLLLPDVLNDLKIKDPPDENQTEFFRCERGKGQFLQRVGPTSLQTQTRHLNIELFLATSRCPFCSPMPAQGCTLHPEALGACR